MKTSLFFDTRSAGAKQLPVKIAIRAHGKSAYIGTGIYIQKNQWRKKCSDGNHVIDHPNARMYNSYLKRKLYDVENALLRVQAGGFPMNASATALRDAVVEMLNPSQSGENSVILCGNRFCATKTKQTTKDIYEHTLSRLRAFIGVSPESLAFDDVDVCWLNRFDAWLSETGSSVNTRSIHLRNLRAIFNFAIDNDITSNYPFRKFHIASEPTTKRSLSLAQLRALWNAPTDERTAYALDVFKLTFYLIGINFVDLHALKPENIAGGRLRYRRSKTGRLYDIKLQPEALSLIDKMRGSDGYLLNLHQRWANHKNGNHRINELLQLIGEWEIGKYNAHIYKPMFPQLTTYWARHSWATLANALDISNETIASALGHQYGNDTTAIYIDISLDKIDRANRAVIDAITKNK